jgi:hypothetical protein
MRREASKYDVRRGAFRVYLREWEWLGWVSLEGLDRRKPTSGFTSWRLAIPPCPLPQSSLQLVQLGPERSSLRFEFLIALGRVSCGQETGRFLEVDILHQYSFLPIGQVCLASA